VPRRRIFHNDQVVTHLRDKADRLYGVRGILEQRTLEVGIQPGPGNRTGTDVRADPILKVIDDGIQGRRFNVALLDEDRLKCANAQLRRIDDLIIVVVPMVAVRMMPMPIIVIVRVSVIAGHRLASPAFGLYA
jgi:hypothetical protein